MRAIVIEEFGPPEVLVPREVPEPVPDEGQVLLDVELANVTFVETQIRAGRAPRPEMLPKLPAILGNGVGGTVAAGDESLIGTRVISGTGGTGGYAERAVVPAGGLLPVPDGMPIADAVALLADGRTAMALMERAGIQPGETVLVEAAAGGVGSLLVQLAKAAGATVIAAAGGERKLTVARELGADRAVDYAQASWAGTIGAPVDVVFDGVGGEIGRTAFELVRSGGRHCAFGMASGAFAAIDEQEAEARGVTLLRGAMLSPDQMLALTRKALDLAAAGELKPVIGQTFPLQRAADAHRAIESRATMGKTLLTVQ
jgi:NADPH2:quinone reductase